MIICTRARQCPNTTQVGSCFKNWSASGPVIQHLPVPSLSYHSIPALFPRPHSESPSLSRNKAIRFRSLLRRVGPAHRSTTFRASRLATSFPARFQPWDRLLHAISAFCCWFGKGLRDVRKSPGLGLPFFFGMASERRAGLRRR